MKTVTRCIDTNPFLKGFVNHKLLSLLGVIVTITLASAANLHIELNKVAEAAGKSGFVNTRVSIKRSARWLIASLIVAVLVVLIKRWSHPTRSCTKPRHRC